MRVLSLLVAAGLVGGGLLYQRGSDAGADASDKVVQVSSDDPAMNAAIGKARETLPGFWAKLAKPGAGEAGFSLKLALEDAGQVEHFWCSDIRGDAAKASCVIANEPATVKTVKLGQRVDVAPARISDWMYQKDGKIKGGQSIRVLLATLPQAEADAYRALLADE
jgi:uncharacterized protein YegJ (DUF2314 family)